MDGAQTQVSEGQEQGVKLDVISSVQRKISHLAAESHTERDSFLSGAPDNPGPNLSNPVHLVIVLHLLRRRDKRRRTVSCKE